MLHRVGPILLRYLLLQFQPVQPALQDRQVLQALPVQMGQMGLPALQDRREQPLVLERQRLQPDL